MPECNCHPLGSKSQQCDENGKCNCKEHVTGDKCDVGGGCTGTICFTPKLPPTRMYWLKLGYWYYWLVKIRYH